MIKAERVWRDFKKEAQAKACRRLLEAKRSQRNTFCPRACRRNSDLRSSRRGEAEMNPTRNHEVGSFPGLARWVKDPELAMSCGVGHRGGSDPALRWLWCGPAASLGTSICRRCGPKKTKRILIC